MAIERREAIMFVAGAALAATRCHASTPYNLGQDDSDALIRIFADMAKTGRAVLSGRTYKVSKPLVIPPGVIEGGHAVFDFREADPKDFPAGVCLLVKGAARMKLPGLQRDLPIGTRTFRFTRPHGLAAGGAFQLSGTVDFAGNGARFYYRKGEMFRVAEVLDSVSIRVEKPCRDSYSAAGTEVWKRAGDRFTQECDSITVIGHDGIDYTARFEGLDRSVISNFRCENGKLGALFIDDCFQLFGEDIRAWQTASDGADPYGCVVSNSQDVTIRGECYGYFNGFTVGGGDPVHGKVGMNRDCHFHGKAGSHPIAGLSGGNLHGNCEYCSLNGAFSNGVSMGGDKNEAHGEFIKSGSPPIVLSEMHGHSFTITGVLRTTGEAELSEEVGALHQTEYGTYARYGGVASVDLKMYVPNATRILVWRPLGLMRRDVDLRLRLDIMEAHPKIRIAALYKMTNSGHELPSIEFDRLNLFDDRVPIRWAIGDGTRLTGPAVRTVLATRR